MIAQAGALSLTGSFFDWMAGAGDPQSVGQIIVAQVTARIALPIFALIDAVYHLTCAVIKLPFVILKITVAQSLGFSGAIPDTLGSPTEWVGDTQLVIAALITVVSSLTLGLISPSAVVNIAEMVGINSVWLNPPSPASNSN